MAVARASKRLRLSTRSLSLFHFRELWSPTFPLSGVGGRAAPAAAGGAVAAHLGLRRLRLRARADARRAARGRSEARPRLFLLWTRGDFSSCIFFYGKSKAEREREREREREWIESVSFFARRERDARGARDRRPRCPRAPSGAAGARSARADAAAASRNSRRRSSSSRRFCGSRTNSRPAGLFSRRGPEAFLLREYNTRWSSEGQDPFHSKCEQTNPISLSLSLSRRLAPRWSVARALLPTRAYLLKHPSTSWAATLVWLLDSALAYDKVAHPKTPAPR